jgi:methylglutaconyl-CoA hydratase
MSDPVLLETRTGSIAVLTLNRPEARNALDAELVGSVTGAFRRAGQDRTVRSVVLTGAGQAFCGGADLKVLRGLQTATVSDNLEDAARIKGMFRAVATCPKPVVAAVNGPALAGGCGLASACDVIIATPEATFGYPEVRIGFVAAVVLVFLSRQVGERAAKSLLLSGRAMNAEAAVGFGLATRVVPSDRLMEEALQEARSLQRGAPGALALTKELLWRTSGMTMESALELAAQVNTFARTSPDMKEGLASFLEKRSPSWNEP